MSGRIVRTARLAAETYEYVDDPEAVVERLRRSGQRVDLFTFTTPLVQQTRSFDYHAESDNLAVIRVSTFDDWWLNVLGFKARNKAKQASKSGVTLRRVPFSDDLVRGIWEIYNETPVRQGKRFPHYGKDLETVYRMTNTFLDRSCFIGAYHEEKLIGFAKLHCDRERTQAGLTHILSLMAHREKSPTNALVAEAVRYCADERISHLVYSRFSDGGKKRDSLMDFKERNGFERVDVPRYYVSLTSLGRLALGLGLHRSLVEYLPPSVLEAYRNVRRTWYTGRATP